MCPPSGPFADFQLGLWVSANSVENINKQSRYKRAESNLLADEKRSPTLDPGSCLGYTSILIDLLSLHCFSHL